MDSTSVKFAFYSTIPRASTPALPGAFGVSIFSALLLLSACAPLPPDPAVAQLPAVPAKITSKSQFPNKRSSEPSSGPLGEQRIPVGSTNGYHTEITLTPPKQVCDLDAFSDGVQYGYAYTWNRLTLEQARDPKRPATAQPQFDPSVIQSQDEQYKIVWNGPQRVNACASDGYLIGRIVGTHRAYIDLKGGSS